MSPNPCYGPAMKRLALIVALGLAGCHPLDVGAPSGEASGPALADVAPPRRTGPAIPYRLIDGDTFEFNGETVRIENIDTPEKPPRAKCIAEVRLAAIAERELADVIAGEWGRLPVIERHGKDQYGRTLAAVKLSDGTDVGEEMIRRGVAEPWAGRRADWCGVQG